MNDADKSLILMVDDEPRIVQFVRMNLELEGYRVSGAHSGLEALEKVRKELPNLVIMDVMMPELDGFETLAHLREISSVPVIMLTVKGEEEDRIRGLDLGADDYMTKPFSPRELASRLRAVLRRTQGDAGPPERQTVRVDDGLTIDFAHREVIVRRGEHIKLRPTEYRLLYHLVQNAGWTVPHETLLSKVWGSEYRDENQLLRLYITYLRQKIEIDSSHPRYIFTERGVGYRFTQLEKGEGNR